MKLDDRSGEDSIDLLWFNMMRNDSTVSPAINSATMENAVS